MTGPDAPFPILAMKTVFVLVLLLTTAATATAQIPHFSATMSENDYTSLYSRDIFSDVYLPAPFSTVDSTWNDAQLRFKGHSTRYYPKKSFRIRFATTHLFDQMRQFNLN